MQNTHMSTITTETKVTIGILVATLLIIVGGIMMFKGGANQGGYEKFITTGLNFPADKVAPAGNPRVMGVGPGTASSTGTSTAPIAITEFLDYECSACASAGEPITKQLLAMYGERVTITRRIYPLHGQPSIEVARMVLAAQSVSNEAYTKLHNKVFETQATWAPMAKAARETFFRNLTKELELNYDTLVAEGATPKYAGQIDVDRSAAIELGIEATPSFILNNTTRITGGLPVEVMRPYIENN